MPASPSKKLAFDMLDKNLKGSLSLSDARLWIRTQGCCLADEDIDRYILSRVQSGKFTLVELTKLVHFNLPGMVPDGEKLKTALETVAGGSDVVVADLRVRLMDNGMSAAEFEGFRQTLKLNATNFTSDELVRKVLGKVAPSN